MKAKQLFVLQQIQTRTVTGFRANFYTHVKGAHNKKCWQCGHNFEDGESVNVCTTVEGQNAVICTPCAVDVGLLSTVDEKGFAILLEREDIAQLRAEQIKWQNK